MLERRFAEAPDRSLNGFLKAVKHSGDSSELTGPRQA
jgi:hypothetical protein